MYKKEIDEMIESPDVYEIRYLKDNEIKIRHISDVRYSPLYGNSCILAFCEEADKELTFRIDKIVYINKLWMGIMSKDAIAPKDGIYLLAFAVLGQGIDIYYKLLSFKEGETFIRRYDSWVKPIAYQFIPLFGEPEGNWKRKEIIIKKGKYEEILAPEDGIPIIAYRRTQNKGMHIDYCVGRVGCQETVWGGIRKGDNVLHCFEDSDYEGYQEWSEFWDDYQVLGFTILKEYGRNVFYRHVEHRLKIEPHFLLD